MDGYPAVVGVDDSERPLWVKLHIVGAGGADLVLTHLSAYRGRGRGRVQRLHKLLSRVVDAIDYDAFRARGCPVGSGEGESAHRYFPQKRLELPGACTPSTISPKLALRVLNANVLVE